MLNATPIDYMNPPVPDALPLYEIPIIRATAENFKDFGSLVTEPETHPVEIVQWPQPGWRPVDAGTGDEGGYAEGTFKFRWQGDVLYGENQAVDDRYLMGWSTQPGQASTETATVARRQLIIWHANYHPDGGQLFYPTDGQPFVTALAPPGDDLKLEDWVAFYCDGSFGICIHPNIWHEAIAPLADEGSFYDKQGKVHGRISCNFADEFGHFLAVPLTLP
ncbi:MAG: ureidoglycolate lyase [Rhodospirillales bacterium]|nr:ureidoglycolate lyase [Rhodospirillales bacterium]